MKKMSGKKGMKGYMRALIILTSLLVLLVPGAMAQVGSTVGCTGFEPNEVCEPGAGETNFNCASDCFCGDGLCHLVSENGVCAPGGGFVCTLDCQISQIEISNIDCSDNLDNDCDLAVDCQDTGCFGVSPACVPESACGGSVFIPPNNPCCSDGLNNDASGGTDCLDSACNGFSNCEFGVEVSCNDNFDNDGDSATDCADPDCTSDPACSSEICNNGVDDNANGLVDCFDTLDCSSDASCSFAFEFPADVTTSPSSVVNVRTILDYGDSNIEAWTVAVRTTTPSACTLSNSANSNPTSPLAFDTYQGSPSVSLTNDDTTNNGVTGSVVLDSDGPTTTLPASASPVDFFEFDVTLTGSSTCVLEFADGVIQNTGGQFEDNLVAVAGFGYDSSSTLDTSDTMTISTVTDTDGDGILDPADNCPNTFNPNTCLQGGILGGACTFNSDCDGASLGSGVCGQPDVDGDGIGDACDPETCTDGVDNDGDGLVDCADPDCSTNAACTTSGSVTGSVTLPSSQPTPSGSTGTAIGSIELDNQLVGSQPPVVGGAVVNVVPGNPVELLFFLLNFFTGGLTGAVVSNVDDTGIQGWQVGVMELSGNCRFVSATLSTFSSTNQLFINGEPMSGVEIIDVAGPDDSVITLLQLDNSIIPPATIPTGSSEVILDFTLETINPVTAPTTCTVDFAPGLSFTGGPALDNIVVVDGESQSFDQVSSSVTFEPTAALCPCGDVNGDSVINENDKQAILDAIAMNPSNPAASITGDPLQADCADPAVDATNALHGPDGSVGPEDAHFLALAFGGQPVVSGGQTYGVTCELTAPAGAVCGNGIVESGEQCDDGNIVSGDGCDEFCQNEVAAEAPEPTVISVTDGDGSLGQNNAILYTVEEGRGLIGDTVYPVQGPAGATDDLQEVSVDPIPSVKDGATIGIFADTTQGFFTSYILTGEFNEDVVFEGLGGPLAGAVPELTSEASLASALVPTVDNRPECTMNNAGDKYYCQFVGAGGRSLLVRFNVDRAPVGPTGTIEMSFDPTLPGSGNAGLPAGVRDLTVAPTAPATGFIDPIFAVTGITNKYAPNERIFFSVYGSAGGWNMDQNTGDMEQGGAYEDTNGDGDNNQDEGNPGSDPNCPNCNGGTGHQDPQDAGNAGWVDGSGLNPSDGEENNGDTYPDEGEGSLQNPGGNTGGGTTGDGSGSSGIPSTGASVGNNCGNNIKEPGEQCDGTDLDSKTCADFGTSGGVLSCKSDCTFQTNQCIAVCGNNLKEGGEVCDGTDLGGNTCNTQLPGTKGTLGCTSICSAFVTTNCVQACGDGIIDSANPYNEQCDDGNTLDNDGCNANCQLEYCGDGIIQTFEDCEGPGSACSPPAGGTCTASTCICQVGGNPTPFCGDGSITFPEVCDIGPDGSPDAPGGGGDDTCPDGSEQPTCDLACLGCRWP